LSGDLSFSRLDVLSEPRARDYLDSICNNNFPPRELNKISLGIGENLITNFPRAMVLLLIPYEQRQFLTLSLRRRGKIKVRDRIRVFSLLLRERVKKLSLPRRVYY